MIFYLLFFRVGGIVGVIIVFDGVGLVVVVVFGGGDGCVCVCVFLHRACFLAVAPQVLYERYEAEPKLSRRTMKARLLWDAILESQVCV